MSDNNFSNKKPSLQIPNREMADKLNLGIAEKRLIPSNFSCLSKLQTIRVIKSKLNPSQLNRFEDSCFGKLFHMSTKIKFSGHLARHLLLRQAGRPSDEEMWFVIGGKSARFSRYEFALITGLDCGEFPGEGTTPRSTTRLRDKYFNGLKSINKRHLKRRFLSCEDEEDTFRLSLVYFLEEVLLGQHWKTKIGLRWLSLVDDLESFNKFPWGKLCFDMTLRYLKMVKARIDKDLNTKKFESTPQVLSYRVGGFPFAFQVWAYEAVPLLTGKYAKKRANLVPRILCWEISVRAENKELRKTVFSSKNLDVLKTLRATEVESEQQYMKSIAKLDHTLEDTYDVEDLGTMPSYGNEKSADCAETSKFFMKSFLLGSLKAVRIIKRKLNPSQQERFEASCFGKLFNMPTNIQLSRETIHQLFFRKADHPEENEIWFAIGDKRARFSLYEFALITGLNCGGYPSSTELKATTRSTRLKDKYFDGRNSVIVKRLEQQFLSCTDEDDAFKLAMIYFLETVLLGRYPSTSIDQRWLSLVDDVEAFNSFVWGKLSYERTLCSLKNVGKSRFRHGSIKKNKKCYSLCGFPYAFQVWVYEAIPSIARKYAKKKANLIPRLLRWECKESANYKEIDPNVFDVENVEVVETLEASEFESEQDYMKSIGSEFTCMLEEKDEDGEDRYSDSDDDEKRSDVMGGISWVRGNGKRTSRKRRKTASYNIFPFSETLKKQTPGTRETVRLSPIRRMGKDDANDLLEWLKGYQNDTDCLQDFVRDCLGKHDSFMDNGDVSMGTEQEQYQQSHVVAAHEIGDIIHEKEHNSQPVFDQPRNSNPYSVDPLELLDAVLRRELDLDFPGKKPSQLKAGLPTTSIFGSHVDTEVIELSDDDDD